MPRDDRRPTVGMALYGDITYDSRVRKEARTLSQAGYDVSVVCLAGETTATDLPEHVRVIVRRPAGSAVIPGATNPYFAADAGRAQTVIRRVGWLISYVRGLRSWGRIAVAAGGQVDIWHAHDLTGLAAIAPYVAKGTPIVYDSHELFLEAGTTSRLPGSIRRLLRRYERQLVSRTSAVITVNQEIADVLRRRYAPRRLAVVHNCPERWSAPADRPNLLRNAAGIPGDAPIILYHGSLTSERGIERLMDAMLEPELADAHLVLMGLGDRQVDYTARAALDVWGGRIHVLDPVSPAELLPWVASADVGAMLNPGSTLNDRFSSPNKLFECLAAGTPVIASDFPTMRRILVDDPAGTLGAVCDPSSAKAIAAAVGSIIHMDRASAGALRDRCAQAAAERWNWQAESGAMTRLYAEILADGG